MNLLFATSNPHKIEEVVTILGPLGISVSGLDALDTVPPEPVEDADSFIGNARLKAVGYAAATGRRCLADDSGIEVDALGGAPGVHSARYSGVPGPRDVRDQANNDKLLAALAGVPAPDRTARFVCAMCLADPDGRIILETRGTFEGLIVESPRGGHGFGYDPLLLVPECGCTSAELDPAEKNARSHRGQAARQLASLLRPEADR